jgi:hypothetical protein
VEKVVQQRRALGNAPALEVVYHLLADEQRLASGVLMRPHHRMPGPVEALQFFLLHLLPSKNYQSMPIL